MNKFIKTHENFLYKSIGDPNADLDFLLAYHKTWIEFLQHERFIHLVVTLVVAFLLIASFGLCMLCKTIPTLILFLIIAILLLFYIIHYYKLENSVQRWYSIYADIVNKKDQK